MADTTNKELKLVISATDPEFQKVIKGVNKALQSLSKTTQQTAAQTSASLNSMATQAKRATDKTATAITRSSRRSSRALGALQRGLFNVRQGIISIAAAAAAGGITKFAADFELALANVNTLLPQGAVSIERYREQLIELSKVSSKEVIDLTKGLYQTISAGIPATEGASGAFAVLERAQAAAVAGLSTTEESVNAIVSVLNAYGPANITAAEASDKLLKTVQLGRTTFPELARAIGRVAPTAAAFNVSADDMFASLIALTRAGLNTNEAVTGLRNVFKSLTQPTQETLDVLDNLNKTSGKVPIAFDAASLRTFGLQGQFQRLTEATGGATEVIGRLFPNLRAALPAIIQVGERTSETAGFLDQLANSAGTVDGAVAKVSPTFSELFKVTRSVFQSAFIEAGETVIPLLNQRLKELRGFVEDNSESFASFFKAAVELADVGIRGLVDGLQRFDDILSNTAVQLGLFITILGTAASKFGAFATAVSAGIASNVFANAFVPPAAATTAATTFAARFLPTLSAALKSGGGIVVAAVVGIFAFAADRVGELIGNILVEIDESASGTTRRAIEAASREAKETLKAIREEGFKTLEEFQAAGSRLRSGGDVVIDREQRLNVKTRFEVGDGDPFTEVVEGLIRGGDGELGTAKIDIKTVESGAKLEIAIDNLKKLQQEVDRLNKVFEETPKANRGVRKRIESDVQALKEAQQENRQTVASLLTGNKEFENSLAELGKKSGGVLLQSAKTGADAQRSLTEIVRRESKLRIQLGLEAGVARKKATDIAIAIAEDSLEEVTAAVKKEQQNIRSLTAEIERVTKAESETPFLVKSGEIPRLKAELERVTSELEKGAGAREKSLSAALEQLRVDRASLEAQAARAEASEKERQNRERLAKLAAAQAKQRNASMRFDRLRQRTQDGLDKAALAKLKLEAKTLETARKLDDLRFKSVKSEQLLMGIFKEQTHLLNQQAVVEAEIIEKRFTLRRNSAERDFKDQIGRIKEEGSTGKRTGEEVAAAIAERKDLLARQNALAEEERLIGLRDVQMKLDDQVTANREKLQGRFRKGIEAREKREEAARKAADEQDRKVWEKKLAAAQAFIGVDERREKAAKEIADTTRISMDDAKVFLDKEVEQAKLLTREAKTRAAEGISAEIRILGLAGKRGAQLKQDVKDAQDGSLVVEGAFIRGAGLLVAAGARLPEIAREYKDAFDLLGEDASDPGATSDLLLMAAKDAGVLLGAAGKEFGTALLGVAERGVLTITGSIEKTMDAFADTANLIGLDFVAYGKSLQESIVGAGQGFASAAETSMTAFVDITDAKVTEFMLGLGSGIDLGDGAIADRMERALATGGEAVGLAISGAIRGGAKVLSLSFRGFVSLLAKTLDSVLTPVTQALQAPLDLIFGSLGDALGLITRTKKDERKAQAERAERNRILEEEFQAKLTEAEAAGATNEEIARLQSQFRSQREAANREEDAEETPGGSMASAFEQAIEMAIRLAEEMPALVEQFLKSLIDALPRIIPALVAALAGAITALAKNLGPILTTAISALVDALPVLIDAIAESLDDILIGVLDGLILLVQRLPEIVTNLVRGLIEALPGIIDAIVELLPELIVAVVEAVPLIVGELIAALPVILIELTAAIPKIVFAIISEVPRMIGAFARGLVTAGGKFVDGIGDAFKVAIDRIFQPIIDFFKGVFDADEALADTGSRAGDVAAEVGIRVGLAALTGGLSEVALIPRTIGQIFHEGGAVASGMRDKATARMFRDLGAAGFQSGGLVTAAASGIRASAMDDVPAILQTGEGVLSRVGMRAAGGERGLDRLNAGQPAAGDVNVSLGIVPNSGGLAAAAAALLPMLISGVVSEINSGTGPLTTAMDGQRGALLGYAPVPGKG